MPYRFWEQLKTTDFEHIDKKLSIVIMPIASIEQHGPHLPVSVDVQITEGVVKAILEKTPEDFTVLVLPMLPIGKANEHIGFDGTLSLSVNTLIGLLTDIAESVFRTGFKKLMILNGHGGNTQTMEIVARDLRVRHDALVVPVNWWSVRDTPRLYPESEYIYGIHGGAEETSIMMHLHPYLVREEHRINFVPNSFLQRERFPLLYGHGIKHAWKSEDIHVAGAMGDASRSTAQDGATIVEDAAASLIALLKEMIEFNMPNCRHPR